MYTNEKGHLTALRIPAFPPKTFCLNACMDLMDIERTAFQEICRSITSSRDVVRNVHENVGNTEPFEVKLET